jgi:hypothetical protein
MCVRVLILCKNKFLDSGKYFILTTFLVTIARKARKTPLELV